jgi:hypothetical protein
MIVYICVYFHILIYSYTGLLDCRRIDPFHASSLHRISVSLAILAGLNINPASTSSSSRRAIASTSVETAPDLLDPDIMDLDIPGPDTLGTDIRGPNVPGPIIPDTDLLDTDIRGPDIPGTDILGTDISIDIRSPDIWEKNTSGLNPPVYMYIICTYINM